MSKGAITLCFENENGDFTTKKVDILPDETVGQLGKRLGLPKENSFFLKVDDMFKGLTDPIDILDCIIEQGGKIVSLENGEKSEYSVKKIKL